MAVFIENPEESLKCCLKAQELHELWLKENEKNAHEMSHFHKKSTVSFIWESNRLEGTLPIGAKQSEVNGVLAKVLEEEDNPDHTTLIDDTSPSQQLANHLHAFIVLCGPKVATRTHKLPVLSEELIKRVHKEMMQGLKTEEGEKVNAGVYRTNPVHAGLHVFPSHECIEKNMAKIVSEYESKISTTHDMYQLASWLFFQVVSLHPFEDGNGRLSRLLWCYSLMRDGLPFPPVLTSGHKRSQKHLVWCLERDRRPTVINQPNLTALTLTSVQKAWNSFLKEVNIAY